MSREALKREVREFFEKRLEALPKKKQARMRRLIADTKHALNYGHDGLGDDTPFRSWTSATQEIREWWEKNMPDELFYDQGTGTVDVGTPDEDCFEEQVIIDTRHMKLICLGGPDGSSLGMYI